MATQKDQTALQRRFQRNVASQNQTSSAPVQDEKPKAEFYANLGYVVDIPNAETGEMEQTFVAIPSAGWAIDTATVPEFKGTHEGMYQRYLAQVAYVEEIQEAVKELAAGEWVVLGNPDDLIRIQLLRKKAAPQAPANGINPFARPKRSVTL